MNQVIASPDEMDTFALQLRLFNERIREEISRLNAAFSRVGETWQDAKYRTFADEYIRTMTTLHDFIQTSEGFIGFLYSESAFLRQYLGRHIG